MRRTSCLGLLVALCVLSGQLCVRAETGADAWLRYARLDGHTRTQYSSLPAQTVVLGDSPVSSAAQQELARGVRGMLGRTLVSTTDVSKPAIIIATIDQLRELEPQLAAKAPLQQDGFRITWVRVHGSRKHYRFVQETRFASKASPTTASTQRSITSSFFLLTGKILNRQQQRDRSRPESSYCNVIILVRD